MLKQQKQTTASEPAVWPYPQLIAHRGAGLQAPENTIAAFVRGAEYGYRMFECDVKLSSDGVPYLMHDSTLDRTTNVQTIKLESTWTYTNSEKKEDKGWNARDQSWDILSKLDAGSWWQQTSFPKKKYTGERMPTLDQVAEWCIANDCDLNIEIKPIPGTERETGMVVAEYADKLWSGSGRSPLLTSFSSESIKGAKEVAPSLMRGMLFSELEEGWYDIVQSLQCTAVVCEEKLWNKETVERPLADGIWCLAYTVNTVESIDRLLSLGLVGIITDQVHNPFPCNRFDAAFSSPSSDEEVVVEEEEFIDIENLTFDIPSPEGGQQMAQEELEDVEAVFQRLRPTTPTLQRSASLDSALEAALAISSQSGFTAPFQKYMRCI